ncbi:MAG: hypothetical protein QM820_19640 [Minicystis sp.]
MPSTFASRAFTAIRKLVPAVAAVAAITCANIDNIDVSAGGKVTVPAATIVDKLLSGALDFTGFNKVDFSQSFENQGVTKDQIDAVHLTSLTLTIESPSGGNFDFLQSLSFSAQADGVGEVEIARIDSIPKGMKEITLDIDADVDLRPYVVAPSLSIKGQAKGARPDQETTISAAAVFDIDIHIPGCN